MCVVYETIPIIVATGSHFRPFVNLTYAVQNLLNKFDPYRVEDLYHLCAKRWYSINRHKIMKVRRS